MNQSKTKTLAILGGMAWPSTEIYYQRINQGVHQRLGRQHSAELLISSIDFQKIIDYQVAGQWGQAAEILGLRVKDFEAIGADGFLIASNTMHLIIEEVQQYSAIPALSIIDATSQSILRDGISKVGFLGTKYVMNHKFFADSYMKRGIELIKPDSSQIKIINQIIFSELIHGKTNEESQEKYIDIITDLERRGAQGVVLGCTEIGILLKGVQMSVPLYDTAVIHTDYAVNWLLDRG
jgi:aspartate racemase